MPRLQKPLLSKTDCEYCDGQVSVIMAAVRTASTPAKRLRIASELLRQVAELRQIKSDSIHELRSAGKGWRVIGQAFGVKHSSARDSVTRSRPWPILPGQSLAPTSTPGGLEP